MRCLVTGASGFVGSHLVRRLLSDRHEVLAVVRRSSDLWRIKDIEQDIQFARTEINEIDSISDDIYAFRPEVIFHLAWKGGNSRKFLNDPAQVLENIPGSLALVRHAHQAGCTSFVFLGSSVEYGKYETPVRETDPPEPTSLYGLSKLATLRLSQALCAEYGMRFVGVRLFWAFGPMDDRLRMIPTVVSKLLLKERPSLTPGEQLWDFLYIDDVVAALVALAIGSSAQGIFNLGSGCPISIRDMVSQIRNVIDPALELGFGEMPYSTDQVMHLEADVSRLRTATDWKPMVSLAEGIRRTVEWYKKQETEHAG